MKRQAQPFAIALFCALLGWATSAWAISPLPGNVLVFNSNHATGKNHEIYRMVKDGSGLKRLTNDPRYDSSWARISPDRTRILFQRTPAGTEGSNYDEMSLWMMNVDGSNLRQLRPDGMDGWPMQGHTEWSPDGARLVMFGGPNRSNPQIYVTDIHGRNARAMTNRPGQNLDPSWSPDGRSIVFIGCPSAICFESDYEVYIMPASGGSATRLTNDKLRDHDPYFSPDGRYLAWLTKSSNSNILGTWGIRIAQNGVGQPRWLINDGHINSYPAWAKNSNKIYFHRMLYGGGLKGFHIYKINADGTGLKGITTNLAGTQEYPDN